MPEKERFYYKKIRPNYDLLLTPSQEKEIRERRDEDDYIYIISSEDRSVSVFGTQHTFSLEDIEGIHERLRDVDLVLIEGTSGFKKIDTIPQDTPDSDVIKNGEQVFIGWLAKKLNIEVKCWDISVPDLMQEALKEFPRLSFLGWLAGNGFKMLTYIRKEKPNKEISESEWANLVVETTGILVTGAEINNAVRHYFRKDFKDLTLEEAEELASPSSSLDTGRIASSMVLKRDKHFLDVVAENLNNSPNISVIFVSAGLSHAITWKRALESMLS